MLTAADRTPLNLATDTGLIEFPVLYVSQLMLPWHTSGLDRALNTDLTQAETMDPDRSDSSDIDSDAYVSSNESDDGVDSDADPRPSHSKQVRVAPAQDPDPAFAVTGRGKRWSLKTVLFICHLMCRHMSWEQYVQLRDENIWPFSNSESTAMWKAVWEDIQAYLAEHGGPDAQMPFELCDSSWKETGRRWLRQLVQCGHLDWQQSNPPGSKVARLADVLTEMHSILLAGIPMPTEGEVCLFESTRDAALLSPRFAQLMADNKIVNHRILWRMLKSMFPKLRFTTQPVKKPREHLDIQVCMHASRRLRMTVRLYMMLCASESSPGLRAATCESCVQGNAQCWLGEPPMVPADWWQADDTALATRILNAFIGDEDFKAFICSEVLRTAVYTDALTQEPRPPKSQVIYDSGNPPVATSKIANAAPGVLPCIGLYMSTSMDMGTISWLQHHALRHGKHHDLTSKPDAKTKYSASQMFEGVTTWADATSEHDKEVMIANDYYNYPEAIVRWDKLRKQDTDSFAELKAKKGFDLNFCLVRCSCRIAHASYTDIGCPFSGCGRCMKICNLPIN